MVLLDLRKRSSGDYLSFGTRAAEMGVAMNAIADVMGHVDINTTRRYALN